jgi:hypothetical protein
MWEPRRLTSLWLFTACYKDRFIIIIIIIIIIYCVEIMYYLSTDFAYHRLNLSDITSDLYTVTMSVIFHTQLTRMLMISIPNFTCLASIFFYFSPSNRKLNINFMQSSYLFTIYKKHYLAKFCTFFEDLLPQHFVTLDQAALVSRPFHVLQRPSSWCY